MKREKILEMAISKKWRKKTVRPKKIKRCVDIAEAADD